jgi:hypothetical protein
MSILIHRSQQSPGVLFFFPGPLVLLSLDAAVLGRFLAGLSSSELKMLSPLLHDFEVGCVGPGSRSSEDKDKVEIDNLESEPEPESESERSIAILSRDSKSFLEGFGTQLIAVDNSDVMFGCAFLKKS